MKIIKKGNYGYLKFQKKVELAKTLAMLFLSVALYNMGLMLTGNKQNLLTYAAILGCLPMAKFAVNVVMFSKAKSCSEQFYKFMQVNNLTPTFWDLFFTDYKKNYQISCIYYRRGCLVGFTEDKNMNIPDAEKHITDRIAAAGFTSITVKIYSDQFKYMERMQELNKIEDDGKNNTFLFDNLLNLSL